MTKLEIQNLIYNYPTLYAEGFTLQEINDVLKLIPNIDKSAFNLKLTSTTVSVFRNNNILYSHLAMVTAIVHGTEVFQKGNK